MKYLAIILVTVLLAACGHKGDKNDPLYKEVMAIHDEVMPKMSTIHKLKKKLRKEENLDHVTPLIKNLDIGKEAMMDWMADFDPPAEGIERKTYLEAQLISVKDMADKINRSISAAEQYFKARSK